MLSCLKADHDHRLLLIAVLVCLTATVTALRLHNCARDATGGLKAAWLLFTGLAAGSGVWATHFIAMLAYKPGLDTGYEPVGTLISLVIAASMLTFSFAVSGLVKVRSSAWAGGASFGLGVAAMHYIGMGAFRTEGVVLWDRELVAASVLIGVSGSILAFVVGGDGRDSRRQLAAGGLLTLAICGLHFVGMGAATVRPDPTILVPERLLLSTPVVTVTVAAISLAILLGGLGTVLIAARARQAAQERLLEVIPEGLAFYDAEDRCVLWNSRYAELIPECAAVLKPGVRFETLVRVGVQQDLYPAAEGRAEAWVAERMALRAAAGTHEQLLADGRWMRIEDRRTPEGGTITLCVDITHLKRTTEQLEKAVKGADAANKAKSEFLANMSHEIRTPLNGVMGVAGVLARSKLEAEQLHMVEMIGSSAQNLERLLTDILDLARVESGKLEVTCEPFHLGRTVRLAAAPYELQAQKKGLTFRIEIERAADVMVMGDPVRLKQILLNLLSNAIKFTRDGEVRLLLVVVEHESRPTFVFSVADTGVGFDSEAGARLFARFEQADGSITRNFGGSGLGLAISRNLADLMGGSLRAESEAGKGSTFTLRLPLERQVSTETFPHTPLPAIAVFRPGQTQRPRVLLAEDHPVNRQVVELVLADLDLELTSVNNGMEAVEAIKGGNFDLVLMDMHMPVMDGLTAIREIRAHETSIGDDPVPVFVLTANAMPEHRQGSLNAGANGHMTKPINAQALVQTVQEVLAGVQCAPPNSTKRRLA